MSEGKAVFEGGATRTESEFRFDLLPSAGVEGAARRFAYGARKHGVWNWAKGGMAFRLATVSHLLGHVFAYLRNGNKLDRNTDAIVCNAMMLCHFEEVEAFEGVPAGAGLAAVAGFRAAFPGALREKVREELKENPVLSRAEDLEKREAAILEQLRASRSGYQTLEWMRDTASTRMEKLLGIPYETARRCTAGMGAESLSSYLAQGDPPQVSE